MAGLWIRHVGAELHKTKRHGRAGISVTVSTRAGRTSKTGCRIAPKLILKKLIPIRAAAIDLFCVNKKFTDLPHENAKELSRWLSRTWACRRAYKLERLRLPRTSSSQVLLKNLTLCAISGLEFSQLYSYSTQIAPWKCCRFNSASSSFVLPTPVPHGTS